MSPTWQVCLRVVDRDHGKPPRCGDPSGGNPIYPLTGLKRQDLTLMRWSPLAAPLTLTYSNQARIALPDGGSVPVIASEPSFGSLWSSAAHRRLAFQVDGVNVVQSVQAWRGNGATVSFLRRSDGTYSAADPDISDKLLVTSAGWRYADAGSRAIESYDPTGKLISVTEASGGLVGYSYSDATTPFEVAPLPGLLIRLEDGFGRSVRFEYEAPIDSPARIRRVSDALGQSTNIEYDTQGNVSRITWPDGAARRLLYEDPALPWALTGILDENSQRFASYSYDSQGHAVSTEHAEGAERYRATYRAAPARSVVETYDESAGILWRDHFWRLPTDAALVLPTGASLSYTASMVNGAPRVTSQSQPAGSGCDASIRYTTYDANGNTASKTDFNGVKSCYENDLGRNLEMTRIEGLASGDACPANLASYVLPPGRQQRKLSRSWHPEWPLGTRLAEPRKTTTWVYNGQPDPTNGNALTTCAPGAAVLPDGKPIAVLCKKVEQVTADPDGSEGASIVPMPNDIVLLLHMDGSEGGTSFIDSSPLNRAVIRGGQVSTSAALAKFGGTSGKFSSATSDTLFLTGSQTTQLPGDFTIEAFVYWNTVTSSNAGIFASGHELFRSGTGKLSWWDGSATRITGSTTLQAGVWYHVALVRKGSTMTAYLDGQPEGSYSSAAVLGAVGAKAETVGSWRGSSEFMNGFIDELRVTKGVALYSGPFVPPTAASSGMTAGSQVWTYTYNQYGQMLTARDPRNKLTTYAYYADTTADHTLGDLQSMTNSKGRVTQYTHYDKSGRLLRSIDPNGTVTDTTYTPRGLVKTAIVTPRSAAVQFTLYDYDGVGQLKKATLPEGVALEYSYDAAHRLTGVKDNAGNFVIYTLDNMGNRKAEDMKDPDGVLARNITRVYDALNRAQSATGAIQ